MTPPDARSPARRLTAAAVAAAAALIVALSIPDIAAPAVAAGDDDPPPVRRILLRPEQLPAELERVRQGVLRQLPRAEFDDLVARAASATLRDPPRLVETTYRAALSGEALVGSATWKVLHRGPSPGLLSAEPLNMAIRKASWDDGSPALLGDLDRRPQAPGLELVVGRPGPQTLAVDWSARGVPEPGGLRFDLRLPACPVAVLELDLPADREPAVPREDGLLTGPRPAPAADHRLWRLAFATATQIDLTIRPSAGSGPPPLVLAKQRTRQDVAPGQTACEFTFDLEAPHGGVRDLTLECDPALRPTEVAVRNLGRWDVEPGGDGAPTRVLVRLREPLQAGTLTLRAVGPAAPGRRWTSPAAAIAGAVPRGDALTVRLHPDLCLDGWRAGQFRLVDSAATPDGGQVLNLQAGLIRTGTGRPSAVLRSAGPDYRVRERLWWQADPDRMAVTAQLTFDVARGPVFRVPLRLPEGWDVERVESDPPDLLAAAPPPAGQDLTAEFNRPLTPGTPARLTVQLTRRSPRAGAADAVPFPDVLPTAARGREGTLAVRVAPVLQSSVSGAP